MNGPIDGDRGDGHNPKSRRVRRRKPRQNWAPELSTVEEVKAELPILAELLHHSFTTSTSDNDNPWGFTVENWPLGPADNDDSASGFLLQLHRWGGQFFIVRKDGGCVGMAITLVLTPEVVTHPRYQFSDFGIGVGDVDFVVYCVRPDFRSQGISTALIRTSIEFTLRLTPRPRRFFVRTHANHEARVIKNFQDFGLRQLGGYSLVQFGNDTPRVILGTEVESLAKLPRDED